VGTVEASVWKRKVNFFLLAIPVVLFHDRLGIDQEFALVALAALALIPLAGFIESAVEELAELLGPFIGGLLHTTFGNTAELFISLSVLLTFPLGQGVDIVLTSIAGVVIRNSLLFLGLATFLGCWRNGRMKFDGENAGEYSTVFALAVIGLSLPTIASFIAAGGASGGAPEATTQVAGATGGTAAPAELILPGHVELSTALAVVLLVSYLSYVLFAVFRFRAGKDLSRKGRRGRRGAFDPALALAEQPDTQALFSEEREQAEGRLEDMDAHLHPKLRQARERRARHKQHGHGAAHAGAHGGHAGGEEQEGVLERSKGLRGALALLILAVSITGVVAMSEQFAHAAEGLVGKDGPLNAYEFFFALVIIPVVGGVVELYGTTGSARANRMELVMATTAGATIQMILLVVPVIVLVGAIYQHPLDLVFKPLEIIIFGAATFTFMLLSRDGESSILEGVQLIALWCLLALTALFLPPATAETAAPGEKPAEGAAIHIVHAGPVVGPVALAPAARTPVAARPA